MTIVVVLFVLLAINYFMLGRLSSTVKTALYIARFTMNVCLAIYRPLMDELEKRGKEGEVDKTLFKNIAESYEDMQNHLETIE